MPKPKKALSTIPRAASWSRRVSRTIRRKRSVPSQPVRPAPASKTSNSLEPVTMKARQMPGKAACDSVSPSSPWRRSTAKHPRTPLTTPSNADPSATLRSV